MIDAGLHLRKPRVAIMGEFSAGKSTLSNLLLGRRALPEKVTATRLPPVWLSAGDAAPYRITLSGEAKPVALDRLEEVPLEDTLYVKLAFDAEILDQCDLIDFPGISDPNMASEVWERMLGQVDAILWCTHATQAWRQSEAAVWEMVPEAVRQNSLLLITRFDKLTTDSDKMRVVGRLARETSGLFAAICPISLTRAIAAEDSEQWQASGAEAFSDALSDVVARATAVTADHPAAPVMERVAAPAPGPAPEPIVAIAPEPAPAPLVLDRPVAPARPYLLTQTVAPAETAEPAPRHVVPRRVRPSGVPQPPRPDRGEGQPLLRAVPSDTAEGEKPAHGGAAGRLRVLFS